MKFVVGALMAMLFVSSSLMADGFNSKTSEGVTQQFDLSVLAELPQYSITTSAPWIEGVATFEGPRLSAVAELLGISLDGITLTAMDDYFVELAQDDILAYQPILALTMNSVPLGDTHFGPMWLIWPFDEHPKINRNSYHMLAIWQVIHIEAPL